MKHNTTKIYERSSKTSCGLYIYVYIHKYIHMYIHACLRTDTQTHAHHQDFEYTTGDKNRISFNVSHGTNCSNTCIV